MTQGKWANAGLSARKRRAARVFRAFDGGDMEVQANKKGALQDAPSAFEKHKPQKAAASSSI